ncbi:MAG: CopG family transcriptional regulator [Verrucomicrobiota bacterium]
MGELDIAKRVSSYYFLSTPTISLKLQEALLADLESESRLRRMNKSALVRAALERELATGLEKKKPSCYDLARDLAGSI